MVLKDTFSLVRKKREIHTYKQSSKSSSIGYCEKLWLDSKIGFYIRISLSFNSTFHDLLEVFCYVLLLLK